MVTTTATSATSSNGLDVNSIVTQLMAVERQPITKLNAKEASYQAKLSAFGMLNSAVGAFQSAVQSLSSPTQFQALKATPSDATIFSASTSSAAVAGSYTLDVTSLAQAQRLVATGQTSSTAAIGTGAATTLTFDFGTITGLLNPATGHYAAGPTSTVASGAFTAPTSASGTGTYGVTIDGLALQAPVAVNAGGTVVTAATLDASMTTFLSAHTGYSKTGSFATNNLVLTKADGSAVTIATALTGDTAAGTFGGAGFVGTTNPTPAAFASNGSGIKTVTINGTNNSLQGIRDAINAAGIGVTAAIINDGSGTPYRLTLTSNNMGVSNSMKVTVAGDATISGLLTNDVTGVQNMSQSATAQNAVFNVNGVAITKTTNSVTDVIQGVTLNLLKPATGATLTIARDTAATTTAINGFVKAYNDLSKMLADSSAYNAATKTAAILQGDATVRSLKTQLRSMLSASVVGTSGVLTTLPQVGITFQKDGSLAVDSAKLSTAMTTYPNDIASLFASVGKGTDSLVSFNAATNSTKAGSYAVNITRLATMGVITGNAVPTNTIAASTAINVTLNGVTASVALTAGTYTATQLATMIQSAINGTSAFSSVGSSVAVTVNGSGFLNISSSLYGSTSAVSMTSGTGTTVAALMGATPTSSTGVDVAGSIGGVTATGSGQLLSAASGDPTGLSIIVNGGVTGARGTLNYSQGYANTLSQWSNSILGNNGIITSVTNGINQTIKDIGLRRDALNTRLIGVEARYRAQFTKLDAMLTSMNNTSTFLTQQLGKL